MKNKRNKKNQDKENKLLKVEMYFISLCLLFMFVFLLSVQGWCVHESWRVCLKKNRLALVAMALCLVSYYCYCRMKYMFKGTTDLAIKIQNVKNKDYEYLTFLTTYIIPLVGFDLSKPRYVIILTILLFVIGVIFLKADFYLANPTLALMGYRLYEFEDEAGKEFVVITMDRLKSGDYIETIPFDGHTYFARRRENKL